MTKTKIANAFLLTILILTLHSCSSSKNYYPTRAKAGYSINYKVNSVKKTGGMSVVTFADHRGRYLLGSDTLKVNDIITMNFVSKL
jgi:hypothetical protein